MNLHVFYQKYMLPYCGTMFPIVWQYTKLPWLYCVLKYNKNLILSNKITHPTIFLPRWTMDLARGGTFRQNESQQKVNMDKHCFQTMKTSSQHVTQFTDNTLITPLHKSLSLHHKQVGFLLRQPPGLRMLLTVNFNTPNGSKFIFDEDVIF